MWGFGGGLGKCREASRKAPRVHLVSRHPSIAKTEIKNTNIEAFVVKLSQKKNFMFSPDTLSGLWTLPEASDKWPALVAVQKKFEALLTSAS